jgi:urease accessory protein
LKTRGGAVILRHLPSSDFKDSSMPQARRLHDRSSVWPLLLCLVALPGVAFAHTGPHHASDLAAGLLHPFTGVDHLLAMLAVGVWAARLGHKAIWALPLAFPSAMMVGAVLGIANVQLPMIESMIAISVVVLGAAVASNVRLPVLASAALISLFAVFHGYAHAIEAPGSNSLDGYATGFICATVLLHMLGVAFGVWLARPDRSMVRQVGGSLVALTGAALLFV